MKKVFILLALLVPGLLLAQSPVPVPAKPKVALPTPAAPQLGANSYILMDFNSGRILVDRDSDIRLDPASITKLMTGYVLFKELDGGNVELTDLVPVSETAWRTPGSRMFIEPDMQVTVEDLMLGMIIQSGNDASVALAEFVGGTEAAFAEVMNYYADELGMVNTNFVNSTGLPDENHYTTARDIALLSSAIISEYPQYYAWYSQKEFTFNEIRQHNRNNLLWRDPAVDGLKTGHTEAAGYCLASSAKRDGMRLISVVMGASSEQSRASESQSLLNYGFRFFETVQLYRAGDKVADSQVWKGETDLVDIGIAEQVFVTIPRGRYDDLEAEVQIRPELIAPLTEGEEVGQVAIMLDEKVIAESTLMTLQEIPEAGFFGRAIDGFKMWSEGFFGDE